MKKTKETRGRLLGAMLALVAAIGIFALGFGAVSMTSYAAAQAKVKAPTGAKIRQDADTASTMVGGAEKDKVLTVLGQKQGADGYVWYQVQVNDTTTGYIRSDLVDVTGEVPSGGEGGGGGETQPPVDVTQVNPISGQVSGETVDIRDTPSAAGQTLGTVPGGTAVTITGYVTDAEGSVWYQVNYISGETQVNGFLISDSCIPSGELTLPGQEPVEPEPEPEPDPVPPKYEVVQKGEDWLLVDNEENPGQGLRISELLDGIEENAQKFYNSEAVVKKQKIIIIVLVFLLVAAVAGIAFLVFKIRETMDSAYFNEVENETLRRKNASGGPEKQKPAMHTVGAKEQQSRSGGTRPAGTAQRPSGAAGQRTSAPAAPRSAEQRMGGGQRPAARSAGTRPAGSAQGARPSGSVQGQGTRQAGTMQGARGSMQGSRPSGSVQGARPSGTVQGSRPSGSAQGQRPMGAQGARRADSAQTRAPQGARPGQNPQKGQPRNFLSDDDEFEFEFLNYDGDEE